LESKERLAPQALRYDFIYSTIRKLLASPFMIKKSEGGMTMRNLELKELRKILICSFAFLVLNACVITGGGVHVGGPPPEPAGGPPPHAPAHGYRAKYQYYYYPSAYVYFDVTRNMYFYLEGTVWRTAAVLPEVYRVKTRGVEYVTIDMDDDRPYKHFEEHKKKFPPGQLKKKSKKKS
jgi:hypothetical protein